MENIDQYRIVAKLGAGGMGEVYRGVDVMLEREVAIKMLRPELSSREDILQRFRSEAVILGRLNHGNIATLYSFGKFHDQFYMALEFVKGETLDSLIRTRGALPWQEAAQYAIGILEGLSHAHALNIVHRDIKPANIIVTPQQQIKILDFGIARILETARLTKTGHLIGTMEYVSPEQIQGKETDARSDLYSVGVALYKMLTGRVPFEKDTEYELIRAHVEDAPAPLRQFSKNIPPALEKAVLKALEKNPERRYADAQQFAAELRQLLHGREAPTPNVRSGGALRLPAFVRDYPGLVFLVLALLAGSALWLWKKNDAPAKDRITKSADSVQPLAEPNHSGGGQAEPEKAAETPNPAGSDNAAERTALLPLAPPPVTPREVADEQRPLTEKTVKPHVKPKSAKASDDPGISDFVNRTLGK